MEQQDLVTPVHPENPPAARHGTSAARAERRVDHEQQQPHYKSYDYADIKTTPVEPSAPPPPWRQLGRDSNAATESRGKRQVGDGVVSGGTDQRPQDFEVFASIPYTHTSSNSTNSTRQTPCRVSDTISSMPSASCADTAFQQDGSDRTRQAPQVKVTLPSREGSTLRRLVDKSKMMQHTVPLPSEHVTEGQGHDHRHHPSTGSTRRGDSSTTPQDGGSQGHSHSSAGADIASTGRKNPLARYLILSGALIVSGLAVRYLWRQLAGLAGGLLILAAHRRAGTDKDDNRPVGDSISMPRRSHERRKSDEIEGEQVSPSLAGVSSPSVRVMETKTKPADDDLRRVGIEEGNGLAAYGGAFADSLPELRQHWHDSGPECNFNVRGPNYMTDRKKMEGLRNVIGLRVAVDCRTDRHLLAIPAGPAAMRLVHVDLFVVEEATFHVASKGRCRDRIAAFSRYFEERRETAPFLFLVNIVIPGTPIISTVIYWALIDEVTPGRGSGNDNFLGMLGRYAEVPGSGYLRLERTPSPPQSNASGESGLQSSPRPSADDTNTAGCEESQGDVGASVDTAAGSALLAQGYAHSLGDSAARSDCVAAAGSGSLKSGSGSSSEVPGVVDALGSEGDGRASLSHGNKEVDAAQKDTVDEGLLLADDFRNERFKLIPSIVAGPFIVRKAVGNKPALLGQKLRQRYFRGPGYVETDVDVGSSMVAARIVSLCRGYARSLTVELGVCIEGRCQEELPEKCVGVARLINVDFDRVEALEVTASATEDTPARGSSPEINGEPGETTTSGYSRMSALGSVQRTTATSPPRAEPEQAPPAGGGGRAAVATKA